MKVYTRISVSDAIEIMKRLVFQYQNVIPKAHFVIELLDIVLKNSLMSFVKELKKKCVHDKKNSNGLLFFKDSLTMGLESWKEKKRH